MHLPERLERRLAEAESEQERTFYRIAALVKSRDSTVLTGGIRDCSQMKQRPLWSKYLKIGIGNLKHLLTINKQLLAERSSNVPPHRQIRIDHSLLARKIRHSRDHLIRKKHERPTHNDYERKRFGMDQSLSLEDKLRFAGLPEAQTEQLRNKISQAVRSTIRVSGEFKPSSETAKASRRNLYIQQVVENTLVLESFYQSCLSRQEVNQEMLDRVRKQLCAVLSYEDWILPAEEAETTSVKPLPVEHGDYRSGTFSKLDEEFDEVLLRLKKAVSQVNLLNQQRLEQPLHQPPQLEVFLKKQAAVKCMAVGLNDFGEAELKRSKNRTRKRLEKILQNVRSGNPSKAQSSEKLLCTTSAAIRPFEICKMNQTSVHCSRKESLHHLSHSQSIINI